MRTRGSCRFGSAAEIWIVPSSRYGWVGKVETVSIAQSDGRGGTSSEITRETITCAIMGSSGGGVDRAHDTANAVHATITNDRADDRIIPTRNEYRCSPAAASAASRWRELTTG